MTSEKAQVNNPSSTGRQSSKSMTEPTMQYYMDLLRRRVWIILTVFTIIFTLGTIKTFKSPEIYQAVAKLIVEKEVPRLISLEGVRNDMQGWDPEFYQTKADLISSRAVMELAVAGPAVSNMFETVELADQGSLSFLGEVRRTFLSLLGGQPPPPPDAWQRLASHISAEHVEDTHFLLLKSEGMDPKRVAFMAKVSAVAYEKYHFQQQAQMHGDTFEFLNVLHLSIKNSLLPKLTTEITIESPINPRNAAEINAKSFFFGLTGIMRSLKLMYSSMLMLIPSAIPVMSVLETTPLGRRIV